MEAAVGERAAQALVKEQEQEGNVHACGGELVGVAGTVAFQQTVAFEFAQIVAELVQPVSIGRKPKRGENGLVDLLRRPAANGVAAMQEDFY